jgi:hypothetical protein
MLTHFVPTLINRRAIVKYPQGQAATDHTGGLPLDAESGVIGSPPFICGAWMDERTVELDRGAQRAQ